MPANDTNIIIVKKLVSRLTNRTICYKGLLSCLLYGMPYCFITQKEPTDIEGQISNNIGLINR